MTAQKSEFRLFGIFGTPLAHTLSPRMQEAAFAKAGLKAFYLPFELNLAQFRKAFRGLRSFALDGFNVTVPYKEAVLPYLDQLTPEAKAVGAVNTVYKQGRRWVGTNTDVYGFLTALRLEGKFSIFGKTALIFGAGGASRSAVYALASQGIARLVITNRHVERAQKLAREFSKKYRKISFQTLSFEDAAFKNSLEDADLIVNATSVGLKDSDSGFFPESVIPKAGAKKKLFFDLIYHKEQTALMKAWNTKGHKTLGGLGMLLYQGAKAFECWTGKPAPIAAMKSELLQALAWNRL